ncbi:MAG: LysM peptidoglycan-binding domain-containing protein [Candidatus Treponema excrementipullorum]|nr:LysM peptidoglycan-binding domain-containing protein [Spirochaetia bacterium]MDD7012617.1 LysM peptidoglycan-binding domain-containing protein [Candidatus Treponema excrementipullorum]
MTKSIGIRLADGSFYPILEDGKPQKKILELTTVSPNQEKILVHLYRSPDSTMKDAEYMFSLKIANLAPHTKGVPTFPLTLMLDENNNLTADCSDSESGATATRVYLPEDQRNPTPDYTVVNGNESSAESPASETHDTDTLLPEIPQDDEPQSPGIVSQDTSDDLFSLPQSLKEFPSFTSSVSHRANPEKLDLPFLDEQNPEDTVKSHTTSTPNFDLPDFDEKFFDTPDTALPTEAPEIEDSSAQDSSPDFDLPDLDEKFFDTPDTALPAETPETKDSSTQDSSPNFDLPDFDEKFFDTPDTALPTEAPETKDSSTPDSSSVNFDLPDFDPPSTENDFTTDNFSIDDIDIPEFDSETKPFEVQEDSLPDFTNYELPDFDEPQHSTDSLSQDFSPNYLTDSLFDRNEESFYKDPDEEDKRSAHKLAVIICILCAIICLGALILITYSVPSKLKSAENSQTTTTFAGKNTVSETTENQAKENEIVIMETPSVIPTIPEETDNKIEFVQYKIKWGDTLWDLAETYYNNPWLYKKIAAANSIPDPDKIIAGTTIVIPR